MTINETKRFKIHKSYKIQKFPNFPYACKKYSEYDEIRKRMPTFASLLSFANAGLFFFSSISWKKFWDGFETTDPFTRMPIF